MKIHSFQPLIAVFILAFLVFQLSAQTNLKLRYSFTSKPGFVDSIVDITGNGYNAKLFGGAKIKQLGSFGILETGTSNGYADMGATTGNLIRTLNDFTISTYLYIDSSVTLNTNGNFVWTFSNADNILSSAVGCMFFSAKTSRYAISLTNYSAEKQVNINTATTKGVWQHITYRQTGTTGEIYINGVLTKSGTVSVLPSQLGATPFNYIARSCYSGDQYLLNSKYYDFRVYNSALTATQISALAVNNLKLDTLVYTDVVDSALAKIQMNTSSPISSDLTLPTSADGGATVLWGSSNPSVVSTSGVVNRPAAGQPNATVTLTATATRNYISKSKTFQITVLAQYSNLQSVRADSAALALTGNLTNLRSNLTLPVSGTEGSTIAWSSNQTSYLNNSGVIVNRPAKNTGKLKVTLTATISKNSVSVTKKFDVYVAEDEGFASYLFAYFTGNNIAQEAIRFALSDDGLIYKALNNDQPIISSAAISNTGGVRDPHILRGNDGLYYMVATDMVSANGWNSNRGIVLLKSSDLTNWTSAKINFPTTFPTQFGSVDRVWAPQTIYDAASGKYMIYMSIRKGSSDYDKVYYAYANSTFTGLETAPQLLFDNSGLSTIDADIIEKDGQFHLFFKTEGNGNGIKKAVSNSLTSGYVLLDKYLDQNSNAVEGGCVFRLYNTDDYVLMYDVYSSGYYEFTKSQDLENFTVLTGNSFDFTPRHGTIIPITLAEKNALNNKWGVAAGVNDIPSKIQIVDYHNGVIEVHSVLSAKIHIFDIKGQLVVSENSGNNITRINISKLQKGIYIIRAKLTNGETRCSRIVLR